MSHPDNIQDWTTIVLKNKYNTIKKRNATEVQKRQDGNRGPSETKLEEPQVMITTDLKQKIINARTALKLNQEKLATGINAKLQEIKLLESGKMTLKEAKQIALRIERKYHIKLLEH